MVTKGADQVATSVAMLDKLETAIRSLYSRQAELQNQIDDLNRLGWVDAKSHWRDEKYLYLIHPMKDGERVREYIGADPQKIAEALDRIARKAEIEEVEKKHSEVSASLSQLIYYLRQAMGVAYQVKW